MDVDKEINSLAAETLALNIVIGHVLSKLAKNPAVRSAITEGFDQAVEVAQSVAVVQGKSASPDHTIKALRIIDELRTIVLGPAGGPKHMV